MTTDTKRGIQNVTRKVLGIAGLVGAAALFQGCFVDSGSGGTCFPGQIQARWILTENNLQVECNPGDEVDLWVDGRAVDPPFLCSAHQGVSPEITGGASHAVKLQLFDSNNTLLSETPTMPLFVPCNSVQPTPVVDFSLTFNSP